MSATESRTIDVTYRPDRALVRLTRPEVRNAINLEMVEALHGVCADLERDARPLILTGADGTFAAGADIAEMKQRGAEDALAGINSRLFDRIARLPMPVIAAVDGPALGGGAELAYACDIRIGSPSARFGNPESLLGIAAAAGATWRLRQIVGSGVAKNIILAGATLDAQTALQHGLLTEVVEPDALLARADAIVDRMLRGSARAIRMTKIAADATSLHPLIDDLTQAILFETDDKRARMTAFLERPKR